MVEENQKLVNKKNLIIFIKISRRKANDYMNAQKEKTSCKGFKRNN